MMGNLLEDLKVPQFVTEEEISSQVNQMVLEIKENKQTHGRSDAVLTQHVISGCILEVGIAKAVGGKVNRMVHDSRNPQTFAWDVEVRDLNLEIKPSAKGHTWFNFNIKGAHNQSDTQLSSADLTTYLKYTQYTDFLIAAYYEKVAGGWMVYAKWLMNSDRFDTFVHPSRGQSAGTTHFYHVKNAISKGACIDLS